MLISFCWLLFSFLSVAISSLRVPISLQILPICDLVTNEVRLAEVCLWQLHAVRNTAAKSVENINTFMLKSERNKEKITFFVAVVVFRLNAILFVLQQFLFNCFAASLFSVKQLYQAISQIPRYVHTRDQLLKDSISISPSMKCILLKNVKGLQSLVF